MRIVIDSNILFSALIKDSLTRKLILEFEGDFLFPAYVLEELHRHKGEILSKSCMRQEEFEQLLCLLLQKMEMVPDKELDRKYGEAMKLAAQTDVDDVLFLACALAYPGSVIWSDDKELKRQDRIKVLNTKEIIEQL